MTKIIKCSCKNEHQDKMYGKSMRLANKTEKVSLNKNYYRCTVCNKETTKWLK